MTTQAYLCDYKRIEVDGSSAKDQLVLDLTLYVGPNLELHISDADWAHLTNDLRSQVQKILTHLAKALKAEGAQ